MGQSAEHVAIIMDGNGRWAQQRGLPRLAGHHEGAKRIREIVQACPSVGVKHRDNICLFNRKLEAHPG